MARESERVPQAGVRQSAGVAPVAGKPARAPLAERPRPVRAVPRRMPQPVETSIQFLKDVRAEMNRVAWPERKMVIASSMVVVFVLVVTGAYLAGIDYVFAKLLQPMLGR